jgi:hypothetical protein
MFELIAYDDKKCTFVYKNNLNNKLYHWSSWDGNYELSDPRTLYDLFIFASYKNTGMPFESFNEMKWFVMEKYLKNMIVQYNNDNKYLSCVESIL